MTRGKIFPGTFFLLVVAGLCTSGCIAIPVGSKTLESDETNREYKTEEQLVAASLVAGVEHDNDGASIAAIACGDYTITTYDLVTAEEDLRKKLVVLGLFPGIGSAWWAGQSMEGSYAYDIFVQPVASIFLNIGLVLPTIVPWFREFSARWEPSDEDDYRGLKRPAASLFGWAKSGYDKKGVQSTSRENERSWDTTEPLENLDVTLTDRSRDFSTSARTDADGEARFDLACLPYLCSEPVTFRIDSPESEVHIDPVDVDVPGSSLGGGLAAVLCHDLAACKWDKIYTDDGQIDFSKGTPSAAPLPRVTATVLEQREDAPDILPVQVTIRNEGSGALYRMAAWTTSNEESFDGLPAVFGRINGGKVASHVLPLPLRCVAGGDRYTVTLQFNEQNGYQPPPLDFSVEGSSLRFPNLVWAADVVDDPARCQSGIVAGIADGVIRPGDAVDVVFTVKNIGQVTAKNVTIEAALPAEPTIAVYGRTDLELGDIAPNATSRGYVNISVKPTCHLMEVPVNVTIREESFGRSVSDTKLLPFDTEIAKQPIRYGTPRTRYVRNDELILRTGASPQASIFGRAEKNAPLRIVGELGDWRMVQIEGRDGAAFAWVHEKDVTNTRPRGSAGNITVGRFNAPPHIVFLEPAADLTTEKARLRLEVVVTDDSRLRDVRLQVGADGKTPKGFEGVVAETRSTAGGGDTRILKHTFDLPMGASVVRVVAVDDEGERSEKSLTITRTPKIGKIYLMSVGINTYPQGYELQCARRDAETFHRFAVKSLGVGSTEATLLVDERATRRQIMTWFGKLRGLTRPEDSVVVLLSGHGMIERDEKYFLTADSEIGNLFGTAISMDEFTRILDMQAEKILVIADACYSGAIRIRGTQEIFKGLAGKGRVLIGYEGPGREDADLGHGYLTHYLIEALEGAGDLDGNGEITIREAYEYSSREVEGRTGTGLWIRGEGDLVLKSGP